MSMMWYRVLLSLLGLLSLWLVLSGIVALELFGRTGGTSHPIETRLLGHHDHYQHCFKY